MHVRVSAFVSLAAHRREISPEVRNLGKLDTPIAPLLYAKHLQIPLCAMAGAIQPHEALAGSHVGRQGRKSGEKKERENETALRNCRSLESHCLIDVITQESV